MVVMVIRSISHCKMGEMVIWGIEPSVVILDSEERVTLSHAEVEYD